MSATRDRGPAAFERPTAEEGGLLAEPLMTAAEAARLLHVPRSTLYELVRSRGLPHVGIASRGMQFTRSDLARWVRENSPMAPSAVPSEIDRKRLPAFAGPLDHPVPHGPGFARLLGHRFHPAAFMAASVLLLARSERYR
jgi:excisionase family DNA binding protein